MILDGSNLTLLTSEVKIEGQLYKRRIKSVSWGYSWDGEYLEEFNKGKLLKCSILLAVLKRNRLDPKSPISDQV